MYVLFLPCSFDEMVDLVCVTVPIEVNHCVGSSAPPRDRPLLLGTSWINEFGAFVKRRLRRVGIVLDWHIAGCFTLSCEGLYHCCPHLLLRLR